MEHDLKCKARIHTNKGYWDDISVHLMNGAIWDHQLHTSVGTSTVVPFTPEEARTFAADLVALAEIVERKIHEREESKLDWRSPDYVPLKAEES